MGSVMALFWWVKRRQNKNQISPIDGATNYLFDCNRGNTLEDHNGNSIREYSQFPKASPHLHQPLVSVKQTLVDRSCQESITEPEEFISTQEENIFNVVAFENDQKTQATPYNVPNYV